MRTMVLLLALASAFVLAADNAVIAPQSAVSHKPQATTYGAESITIPQMLSYQGKLTDTLGVPVPDGGHSVAFKLYTLPSGGSSFWNETQTVTTKTGLFSVLLGSVTPIGSIPAAGAVYLGMSVSGGARNSRPGCASSARRTSTRLIPRTTRLPQRAVAVTTPGCAGLRRMTAYCGPSTTSALPEAEQVTR